MDATPYIRDCPTRQILDRIGDRWTVLVIGALETGPMRFSELRTRVDGVSQKMLTQTLRALERDGLADRSVYAEVPPRVEYTLTPLGRSLLEPLRALTEWTITNHGSVLDARAAYDRADA